MTELEQKSQLIENIQNQHLQFDRRGITLEEDSLTNLFLAVSSKQKNSPLIICQGYSSNEDNYEQKQSDQKTLGLTKMIEVAFSCSHFLNLRQLKICELKINNIEFMTFLNAPFLQEFSVNQSQITNVKALNKTNFTMLSNIRLTNASVSQVNLGRMRLSKTPSYLFLEQDTPEQTTMQDLSQLVKLETKWLHNLFIESENRIHQQQLSIFTFQKRFHQIEENQTVRSIQIYEKDGLLDFDGIKM